MEVNIFASSDVHGFINNYDYAKDEFCYNSLASINYFYKNINLENKILVDNGDMIQGNFIGNFTENTPHPAINIMNYMGYKVWNLGNHEFNYGVNNLKNIINQFNGDTLLANSNDPFFKKYTVLNINGLKIAFVGIDTPLINNFESKEALGDFVITDPVAELEPVLSELKGKCNAIVGLFHLGLKDENAYLNSGVYSIIDNLKDSSLIDVIVCGHTHKKIESVLYKNILITQPYVYANNISHIKLVFEKGKLTERSSKLIDVKNYPADENITGYFNYFNDEILKFTRKVIGNIENADENAKVDFEDSPLAHLISDIMLHFSSADVTAFQIDNSDAFLKNGPLTRSDMANLYSYAGGEVTEFEITGADLKKYMEWSAEYFYKDNNKIAVNEKRAKLKYKTFDIFGNIKYIINLNKPVGERIENLKYLNGNNILDNDKIIIAVNEYRMNFLMSQHGPLYGRNFKKLRTTKYQDEKGHKHGTIRGDLAEEFFSKLPDKTYVVDNNKNFVIK